MKIKYLPAILLILIFTAIAQSSPASPAFQDIESSFAKDAIIELSSRGLISGLGANEFGPVQSISRVHFAVLLARVLGVQPYSPASPTFSDLPLSAPESGYVEALVKLGLVAGAGDRIMGAGDPVKRQDAAVLLAGAMREESLEEPYLNGRFLDEYQISSYAVKSVAYASGRGLMGGGDNLFRPQEALTRAEAAVLARQLLRLREGQALNAFPVIASRQLWIKTGETSNIAPGYDQQPLPFTTVYGLDDPAAGCISTDGTFSAGQLPGQAAITVNAGYSSYLVHTNVTSSGAPVKTAGKATVCWPEEELTAGATYKVEADAPDQGFHATEEKSYPGPKEGLTCRDETWTGFFRQEGRDITVDLKRVAPVSKISLEFEQEAGSGIYFPKYMNCLISMDGKNWYHLGRVSHSIDPAGPAVMCKDFTLTFPPVAARYVKISFPVDVFVFARHLSIKGGEAQPQSPVFLAHDRQAGPSADTYLQLPDIKNMLLVFTGSHGDLGRWASQDFLPMLVYVDQNHSIEGKMFDTLLFLPYPDLACTRDSWAAYAGDLFAPGAQLPALEETAARMNQRPGYQSKVNVILTLPYPDGQQGNFGALESGGSSLCFSEEKAGQDQAAGDRLLAVRWFYDNLMARWEQAGFKHLNLSGIYWYKESMDPTTPGDVQLVQDTARLVRGDGLDFFWIPFFGAHGYDNWKSYGFNHAFLQPNYYASNIPPDERMDKAAGLAKRYNLGLEIECDEGILSSPAYYNLFYKQLNKAQQLNVDKEASMAYYAGSKTLLKAYLSSNDNTRSIYDDMYKWLNGTYKAPANP